MSDPKRGGWRPLRPGALARSWVLLLSVIGLPPGGLAVAAGAACSDADCVVATVDADACIEVAGQPVIAEVARTPEQRRVGLMFRDDVPDGTGMLFVYEQPQVLRFWMRNTPTPLDVVFIDERLRVVGIRSMSPLSDVVHHGPEPTRLALELRQGWFAEQGGRLGEPIRITPCGPGNAVSTPP